jgi:hypothetical protein
MIWVLLRLRIYWLELLHWLEWRWWETKWVRVKNGRKFYGRWPQSHQSSPRWKRRVERVALIGELWKRLKT